MADRNRHQELLDTYSDSSAKGARKATLGMVSFKQMQMLASEAGVCEQGDSADTLREKLAEEGYFVGGVGDDNVYRVVEDGDVVKASSSLD